MADAEFAKTSSLEISFPASSDLSIEDILEEAAEQDESTLISSIPQRNLLFFGAIYMSSLMHLKCAKQFQDENLLLYVILKTSYKDEKPLKEQISRLAITLEAHAISSPTVATPTSERPNSSASQPRDVIWTGKVDVSEEPFTIVAGGVEQEGRQDVFLIWKLSAFLGSNSYSEVRQSVLNY